MKIKDHFSKEHFEELLDDAILFARSSRESTFVGDIAERYAQDRMNADFSVEDKVRLKAIAGWNHE